MGVYIGVDFHVRSQTVSWCDTAEGEIHQRRLDHQRDDVPGFYAQFPAPAIVGLESSGYALWFHQLIEELGHHVRVGDAFAIRQLARRRQKNDRRDAELILDLLLRGDFPAVHVPCATSRDVLSLLRYRHRLVRMRTMVKNSLQTVALSHRLRLRAQLFSTAGRERLQALPVLGAHALQRQQSLVLLETLEEQIRALNKELTARAEGDTRVARLRTHPGVGLLTSLVVVHSLDPVSRFRQSRQVAAYCGLDPQEHSSGDRQRYGHISKQGKRLLRTLLVDAAFCAVRPGQDDSLRRFYLRLLHRKRNGGIAIVAVARKLAVRLYKMLNAGIDYDEFRRRGRNAGRARWEQSPACRPG